MSSNLPPGVSENSIPGNRPEDEMEELFWDALYNMVKNHNAGFGFIVEAIGDDPDHPIVYIINQARVIEYERGFADGRDEEKMAQMAEECNRCGYAHSLNESCVVE